MGSKTTKTLFIGMAISAACALRAHRLLVMQQLQKKLADRSAELSQTQAELLTLRAEERNPLDAIYSLAEIAATPIESDNNVTIWLNAEDFASDATASPRDTQASSPHRPLSV